MDRQRYLHIRKSLDLKTRPSALLLHYIQDGLLLAGAVAWATYFSESPTRYFCIPLLSIIIFRNFSLMHDAVHSAVSKRKWLNDFAGLLAGCLCLLPFAPWKKSHLDHHYWSGNIEKDPVMALVIKYPLFSRGQKWFLSFLWTKWVPILAVLQYTVFWSLSLRQLSSRPFSGKNAVSMISPILLWTSIIAFLPLSTTLSIIVPAVLLYFVAVEVVNLPHHLEMPFHRGETRFALWDQHQTARTCLYPKWIARFVVLNFNYHIEHHMFPDVPWYHLDKLHQAVSPILGQSYNTDRQFEWILNNRHKSIGQLVQEPGTDSLSNRRTA